jgi:hypothetical protein
MNDQADVPAHAKGPEVSVLGLVELVKLHPRGGRVHLKIEGRGLHGLLLIAGQPRQAIGEGVGDAEVDGLHSRASGCVSP